MKKIIFFIASIVLLLIAWKVFNSKRESSDEDNLNLSISSGQQPAEIGRSQNNNAQSNSTDNSIPLSDPLSRMTKKPFGVYISPQSSPVQPERFKGYHTGVDLEIKPEELDADVPVKSLCDGQLLSAKSATGYGGVAVQSCSLDNQDVTVIYGHINLKSLNAKVGDKFHRGDFLANLGKAYSDETDEERKHLHLGIHKGRDISILGYVQSQSELSSWLDPIKFLQ